MQWPFLARPLEKFLSGTLKRNVVVRDTVEPTVENPAGSAGTAAAGPQPFGVRFLGGIKLHSPHFEIAAPEWSKAPHFLSAGDVALKLRYADLCRAYRGKQLRIDDLAAATLDANLERLEDGRSSWQFGEAPAQKDAADDKAAAVPLFGNLEVAKGVIRYTDAPLRVEMVANLSLENGATVATPVSGTASGTRNVLTVNATGKYRDMPLKVDLISTGVLPWTVADAPAVSIPVVIKASAGSARLTFNGTTQDAMHLSGMSGRFTLSGASLADAGKPVGVTLPTTGAFRTAGVIVKQGDTWRVVIEDATVGSSRLNGAFSYEAGRPVPLLAGKLGGSRLLLADLGPAIGATPVAGAAKTTSKSGESRVLPDRKFELASLRVMDANVLFDIAEVDLNTTVLEPLRPLHGRIQLDGGVLKLTELSARTARGKVTGAWSLDGRGTTGLWDADLRWEDVQLDKWIHQDRKSGPGGAPNPPNFISGSLNGRATVKGRGQSTAEILGTLKGRALTELESGEMSHLIVELAGLDLAQGLGLLLKGDKKIAVDCAVAELIADEGVFKSRVTVIDTPDSTIWVEGTVSMASEGLDMRAVVTPKDFSPLTLRTPINVRGSFADPKVSIDKAPLTRKLGTAALLSLATPFAALIPLIDRGDRKLAQERAKGCYALAERGRAKLLSANRIQ